MPEDALNTDVSNHQLTSNTRFAQSLASLTGRRQRSQQQPRYYYFPELPQIQFFNPADFAWVASLEAQTAVIRAELLEVMKEHAAFNPYVEGNPNRPQRSQGDRDGMLNNPDWSGRPSICGKTAK